MLHSGTSRVRPVGRADAAAWERLRQSLWPAEPGEHAREIEAYFAGQLEEPTEVLLAFDETGQPLGLIEMSIWSAAPGCSTNRIAYVEGWYVEPHARRRGVGTALMRAAEAWAHTVGCAEMASDTEPGNDVGRAAHRGVGFEEVGSTRCFARVL